MSKDEEDDDEVYCIAIVTSFINEGDLIQEVRQQILPLNYSGLENTIFTL